jgi:hypothetical protein
MLFLLITTVLGSISPADYIYNANRPKIAAHRGLCSVFPGIVISNKKIHCNHLRVLCF